MRGLGEKSATPQQRSNTTVHVCWHRATSVAAQDYSLAVQIQYPLMSSKRAQRGGLGVLTSSTPHLPATHSTDFNLTTLGAYYLFPSPLFLTALHITYMHY
ncbi:FERM, RhoGEF and pleckstrin domain-containing protein 1 [Portunus trituberculatus]|uniref:FERM, RhoGEF and pleckstrin domain-containing protein 1 n=1 Tax=Portunus trituberculatus TaxID=210409 RepID=A0A5B7HEA7_PORTR|nr:FERM, RhoGEF and pleckstrin domain-containing protein 1 [Portunus trituberculatus]